MDTTTQDPPPKRVRALDGTRAEGTVIDVDAEWIYWFGDDRSCRVSRRDFLEVLS